MATYDLAFHTRLDGYAVLQTFVETGIQVGDSVVVAGASHGFSATATIVSTQDFEFIGVSDEGDLLFDSDVIRLYQFLYVNAGTTSLETPPPAPSPSPQASVGSLTQWFLNSWALTLQPPTTPPSSLLA